MPRSIVGRRCSSSRRRGRRLATPACGGSTSDGLAERGVRSAGVDPLSSATLAIVNPIAGAGRCGRLARRLLPRLVAEGLVDRVAWTGAAGEATELARRAFDDGTRTFVAVGGDGTAYEVLNGILPPALATKERVRLAVLPLGTGNSLLRDLAPDGVEGVCEALARGSARACDVLRLDHAEGSRYVLGHVALGLAADVSVRVNRFLKPFGVAGYALGAVLSLLSSEASRTLTVEATIDGRERLTGPVHFLVLGNNRTVGGNLRMLPEADPFDGEGDLLWTLPVSRLELLKTLPRLFDGSHVQHPAIETRRFTHFELSSVERQRVLLDGEVELLEPQSVDLLAAAVDLVL